MNGIARGVVLALAPLTALSAVGGALYLVLDHDLPLALLDGTPFGSFAAPALLLGVVVGGSLAACAWLVAARRELAIDATILAGGALSVWIACESVVLRAHSFLQIVCGAIGVVLLGIGVREAWRSRVPRHRWIVMVTTGEAMGFLVPSLAGLAAVALGLDPTVRALLLVAAGAVEGLACGTGQALALPLPIDRTRFAAWTALGAALVWAFAMTLVALGHGGAPPALVLGVAIAGAPFALAAMGATQWLALRRCTPRARPWIVWSALAWALALPLSFAPAPFVDASSPASVQIVLWSAAGLAMAYVMALVTWRGVTAIA